MIEQLAWTLAVSLAVQAAFFAFAASLKTDKVTDLSYGLTFVLLAGVMIVRADAGLSGVVLAAMVGAWGLRIAGYLAYRIQVMGRDARFDGVREKFWPFLKFWVLQGVAVWLIMLPVTLWFARQPARSPGVIESAGAVIWAFGLGVESVADAQKFTFKRSARGRDRWTDTGLWRLARHPNYFGELLVWWGIWIFAAPSLGWWNILSLAGPLTITGLLLWVTGIPPLELSARKKWGGDPDYEAYQRRTRLLLPFPRFRRGA